DTGAGPKPAVTVESALRVTTHVPVPEHPPPLQPVNVEQDESAAGRVTLFPVGTAAAHVAPQLIPLGDDDTVPEPLPLFETVNVDVGIGGNPASTVESDDRLTTHVPVPEHPPPLQPVNVEPDDAVAVSVTLFPVGNAAAHVVPQLIPLGDDDTVPVPVPLFVTLSVDVGIRLKVAVTLVVDDRGPTHA